MITAPPVIAGAALLLWGVQSGHLLPALLLAVVAELPWRVGWRWAFSQRELNRISDFSGVLFALLVVYQFNARGMHGIYAILELSPYVLFLLLAAQRYSTRGALRLSTLFVSLRRPEGEPAAPGDRLFDIGHAYTVVTLVAASAGERNAWFLPAAALLVAWMLWPLRPRRYAALIWVAMLLAAVVLGYGAQAGIRAGQHLVERTALLWLNQFAWSQPSPDHASTAIGAIGRLKMSDRIVLRVRPSQPLHEPLLLREAAYDSFEFGTWKASRRGFERIDRPPGQEAWTLAGRAGAQETVIRARFERETGVAALPPAAARLRSADVLELQRNAYGTVLLEVPPGPVRYAVAFDAGAAPASGPPSEQDLAVPASYARGLEQVLAGFIEPGLAPAQVAGAIERHFAREFRYSAVQRGRWPTRRPLLRFLTDERAGHCEHFASATVLLLRAAGVPARYAVGYSVSEHSALEGQYVARARHAHSWAEAWIDGRWQNIDTTPAGWAALEAADEPLAQGLFDAWSWLAFRLDRLRSGELEASGQLLWLLPPLAALLAWRLARRRRYRSPAPAARPRTVAAGARSEFMRLVERCGELGLAPRSGEPLGRWLQRLEEAAPPAVPVWRMQALLALHNRQRFTAAGLDESQQRALREGVQECLTALRRPA